MRVLFFALLLSQIKEAFCELSFEMVEPTRKASNFMVQHDGGVFMDGYHGWMEFDLPIDLEGEVSVQCLTGSRAGREFWLTAYNRENPSAAVSVLWIDESFNTGGFGEANTKMVERVLDIGGMQGVNTLRWEDKNGGYSPHMFGTAKVNQISEYESTPSTGDAGSCFHASGVATLESGASKKMSELSLGDVVQIADEAGKISFSQVLLLPHKKNDELATFLNLTTESGKATLMTPDHLIPRCGEMMILSMASELVVGDCLLTTDGKETLTEITSVVANGIYTAVTKAKFIAVDGIIASPFSRDSDRDHSMREYEEFRNLLENKQELELDKAKRKQ